MSPLCFAPPGNATVDCISTMLRQFPNLQSLSYSDAELLVTKLRQCNPVNHDEVIKCMSEIELGGLYDHSSETVMNNSVPGYNQPHIFAEGDMSLLE